MSGAFRTKADWELKNYIEVVFQNGGSSESIDVYGKSWYL